LSTARKPIGFDRKIQLGWLDATAGWAAEGLSPREIRNRLDEVLAGKVAGSGSHSARGKTKTVLLHICLFCVRTDLTNPCNEPQGYGAFEGANGPALCPAKCPTTDPLPPYKPLPATGFRRPHVEATTSGSRPAWHMGIIISCVIAATYRGVGPDERGPFRGHGPHSWSLVRCWTAWLRGAASEHSRGRRRGKTFSCQVIPQKTTWRPFAGRL